MATKSSGKSREKRQVIAGVARVEASFNNTIITITDMHGNALAWSSSGSAGFKGSKKSTPFAAQSAAEQVGRKVQQEFGMKSLDIEIKGPGSGRESAIRSLQAVGFDINSLRDITPVPHNGCRAKKRRRV